MTYPRLENSLKRRLAAGELALCQRTTLVLTPEIAPMARACGFDALYVDLEHCPATSQDVAGICAMAAAVGIASLVRVSGAGDPMTGIALDAGALGIIAPHVDTPEEARRAVAACKFPPLGERSAGSSGYQTDYAALGIREVARHHDAATTVVVMIESAQGVRNAEAIAAVEGVDILLVGTTDLSLQLGVPGEHDAPAVAEAYETVARACRSNGKTLGIAGIGDARIIDRYVALGARFVSAGTDASFLMAGAKARVAALRGLPALTTGGAR
jgi:2-keto-3-deoxy-L-rhamnonate aldolase RhmA